MKRAFTLIEMMIVVAILAILMTITFRLTGSSENDVRRTVTIARMQKIENCLSGYYAAFGSYPPVPIYGSRDIFCPVDLYGDPKSSASGTQQRLTSLDESSVKAACRSQPFGCEYPPSAEETAAIEAYGRTMSERCQNGNKWLNYGPSSWRYGYAFDGSMTAADPEEGGFKLTLRGSGQKSDWNTDGVRLFKYGVMSYLLPRYLFMMRGNATWFEEGEECLQWAENNDMPCNPYTGKSFSLAGSTPGSSTEKGWMAVRDLAGGTEESEGQDESEKLRNRRNIENIPSQAVCARWMPNLEKLCQTTISGMTFFGVDICDPDEMYGTWRQTYNGFTTDKSNDFALCPPGFLPIHNPPDNSGGAPYCNALVTIQDGWHQDFYYYSPEPYQSYILWSSGPNKSTFPPWLSLKEEDIDLTDEEIEQATEWKQDDIISMGGGAR